MKKLILSILIILTMSGCDYFNGSNSDVDAQLHDDVTSDQISFNYDLNSMEYNLSSRTVPDDVASFLQRVNVAEIKLINNQLAVIYSEGSIFNKSLVVYNEDYNINFELLNYRRISIVEENPNEIIVEKDKRFYIEYCDELFECSTGIYTNDGVELYTLNNIDSIRTSNDQSELKKIPIMIGTDEYYVLERPDRRHRLLYERYKFVKYSSEGRVELHSFAAANYEAYQLRDDSFVFAYSLEGYNQRYRYDRVSKDGVLLASYDSYGSFNITILSDGYLTISNGVIERKTFEDEVVWQVSEIHERAYYVNEQAGLIYISSSEQDYKITMDGSVIQYDYSELVNTQICSNKTLLSDNTYCLNLIRDDNNNQVGISMSRNDIELWEVMFDQVNEIRILNNVIYVVNNLDDKQWVSTYEFDGEKLHDFEYDGVFHTVKNDGNIIISEHKNGLFSTGFYVTEYTVAGNKLWSSELGMVIRNIEEHFGFLYLRVEKFSIGLDEPPIPSWDILIDSSGTILFNTDDDFTFSFLLGYTENSVYYYIQGGDASFTDSNVIEVDYDGNIIGGYKYLGQSNGIYTIIKGNELVTLELYKVLHLESF